MVKLAASPWEFSRKPAGSVLDKKSSYRLKEGVLGASCLLTRSADRASCCPTAQPETERKQPCALLHWALCSTCPLWGQGEPRNAREEPQSMYRDQPEHRSVWEACKGEGKAEARCQLCSICQNGKNNMSVSLPYKGAQQAMAQPGGGYAELKPPWKPIRNGKGCKWSMGRGPWDRQALLAITRVWHMPFPTKIWDRFFH